ncbi:MAG: 4-hydroxythreonine-4-phosphate dehydrogenase PdxA [Deltaproteobacteria bacterium]|nr:4-hydroxythreonine-4-phosphate dehydrogenase PdxA [Deltaproteobacteria bacterium]
MTTTKENDAPTAPRTLALTMGDPAGVGPEIICRALISMTPAERARVLVVGHEETMQRAAHVVGADLNFGETVRSEADIRLVHVNSPEVERVEPGVASAAGGAAAYAYVYRSVELALSGRVGAIVTAPLNKSALHAAGYKFDGHTGLLQSLTKAPSSFMLLAGARLSTIHVSTHVSLQDAITRTRADRILQTIEAGVAHLRELGIQSPRIAVAGLNPHAGEGGMFGNQELTEIEPAVVAARSKGITVTGPLPPDSVFLRASQGEFDLVVAMYHDQGHIPTKLLAFDTTVNVSLGLPIKRTSVDHGTAFDIAWKGIARSENMVAAIEYAHRMIGANRADAG